MSSFYDFDIYKGATLSLTLTLKDSNDTAIDLTPYNVSGYLKYKHSDANKLCDLNPVKTTPTSGIITLTIPATGTAVLPCGYGFYDIELHHTGNGMVLKVLNGKTLIYPEVTY
jgi:hypothetical protein